MSFLTCLVSLALAAPPMSAEKVLEGADARIQKHRTGEMTLKLVGPAGEAIAAGRSVRIEQTRHAFLFGCNIFTLGRCATPEDNAAYEKHFAELLNFATVPFYWWGYEKERGEPNDARTERMATWCKEHDITVKGHPLAWNYRDPKWLPEDPAEAMKLQVARIERCTKRFAGVVDMWDVVNEATNYNRGECWKQSPILTRAIYDMGVGPYVRSCFEAARRGNPDATLLINDYRTEKDYTAKVIDELVDLERKPMYDVIGIQSHQHGGPWPIDEAWEVCERFAVYGKPLHFTETTFLSGELGWQLAEQRKAEGFKWESTPEGEKRQADWVVKFYTVLFSHPSVEAITWWDFTDQSSWQRAPAGLLRADMTPKPAYNELLERIKGTWWTKTQAKVNDQGEATFRGFYGNYKIELPLDGGTTWTGKFAFTKATEGPIEVRLK